MDTTQKKFEELFSGNMQEDSAHDFLVGLYEKKETAHEIAIAAKVMRKHALSLPIDDLLASEAIDIVGTGGDRSGTFNISTAVSLLVASLGCKVAKHGNRSITSKSGSADVLEALGINLHLDPSKQAQMLQEGGFCFVFAPDYHPAMKHIMPIRKSIPHRTIFNILGPLTNPAGVQKYLLGVFDPEFIPPIAEAMLELGVKRAFVVSSQDGTDEISLGAKTSFAYIESGLVSYGEINPQAFGFAPASKEELLGGDSTMNAQIIRDIFSTEEQGPKRDVVLLNAAFALFVAGACRDIPHGIEMAKEAIDYGKASAHLAKLITLSNTL
ncbi:MAG TPA: anthranilate phosphoribosyltransferase [Epsilonproteobacteria bacterium]|nr:anthranilate phosphoribosyltransferase [Campylobacterota bacterium]